MGLGEARRGGAGWWGGAFSPQACGARLAAEGCFPKSSKAAGRRGWAAAGSSACTVPLRAGSGVPMPPKNSVFPRLGWIPCRAAVSLPGAGTAATSLPAGQPTGLQSPGESGREQAGAGLNPAPKPPPSPKNRWQTRQGSSERGEEKSWPPVEVGVGGLQGGLLLPLLVPVNRALGRGGCARGGGREEGIIGFSWQGRPYRTPLARALSAGKAPRPPPAPW